jgi:translation initiation factor IF-2
MSKMTERDVYLMLGTDDEKKRPSVVCGEVNNAIYTMKVVAESYGVVFSDAVIDQLYKELDEHLKRMQKL